MNIHIHHEYVDVYHVDLLLHVYTSMNWREIGEKLGFCNWQKGAWFRHTHIHTLDNFFVSLLEIKTWCIIISLFFFLGVNFLLICFCTKNYIFCEWVVCKKGVYDNLVVVSIFRANEIHNIHGTTFRAAVVFVGLVQVDPNGFVRFSRETYSIYIERVRI